VKPIEIDDHTRHRMDLRGTTEDEVVVTIREAKKEGAKNKRFQSRKSFPCGQEWNGRKYNTKQIKVIYQELENAIIVDTVYVFYF